MSIVAVSVVVWVTAECEKMWTVDTDASATR